MPQVNISPDSYFFQLLRNRQNDVSFLATQGRGLPTVGKSATSTLSTTSATPVSLAGSPSATVQLGVSGDAIICVNSSISIVTANTTGYIDLLMNGTTIVSEAVAYGSGSISGGSMSSTFLLSSAITLVANANPTFTLQYHSSTSGDQINFGGPSIIVQPL
jgi:hypothetical protein